MQLSTHNVPDKSYWLDHHDNTTLKKVVFLDTVQKMKKGRKNRSSIEDDGIFVTFLTIKLYAKVAMTPHYLQYWRMCGVLLFLIVKAPHAAH